MSEIVGETDKIDADPSESDCVFVSYAHDDSEFVLPLATALREDGIDIWLDQWELKPSDDWQLRIGEALKRCPILLVILSPDSVKSPEVRGELQFALNEESKKRVVPVLYKKCEIPSRLLIIQYADFTENSPSDERAVGALAATIRGESPIAATALSDKEKRARRRRRWVLWSSPIAFGLNLWLLLVFSKRLWGEPISMWSWLVQLKEALLVVAFFGAVLIWYVRYMRLRGLEDRRLRQTLLFDARGQVRTWLVFAAWALVPALAVLWRVAPGPLDIVAVSGTIPFAEVFRYYEFNPRVYEPRDGCYYVVTTRLGAFNPDTIYRLVIGIRSADPEQLGVDPATLPVKLEGIYFDPPRNLANATTDRNEGYVEILERKQTLTGGDSLGVVYQQKSDVELPDGVELYATFGSMRQESPYEISKPLHWDECR